MSEKVHEVPESILEELFLAARATARRDYITSSLADALDFAELVLSGDATKGGEAIPDLLPCPFCGGEAVLRRYEDLRWVGCPVCAARTDIWSSADKAIDAWNRRTAIPSLAVELPPDTPEELMPGRTVI